MKEALLPAQVEAGPEAEQGHEEQEGEQRHGVGCGGAGGLCQARGDSKLGRVFNPVQPAFRLARTTRLVLIETVQIALPPVLAQRHFGLCHGRPRPGFDTTRAYGSGTFRMACQRSRPDPVRLLQTHGGRRWKIALIIFMAVFATTYAKAALELVFDECSPLMGPSVSYGYVFKTKDDRQLMVIVRKAANDNFALSVQFDSTQREISAFKKAYPELPRAIAASISGHGEVVPVRWTADRVK